MSTFIGQLVGFAVIVWVIWRYVVPPVKKLMADQQNTVRQQLADSSAAADRLAESSRAHAKAKEDANAEARRLTEEARDDAARIEEQLRAQAETDAERIKQQGAKQVELMRSQLIRQLRQDIGAESVRRAGDLVRGYVAEPSQQAATVDRFLDDLDEMSTSTADIDYPVADKMRSASRQALSSLLEEFGGIADKLDDKGLSTLTDELTSVAALLIRETVVTRYLTQPTEDSAPRVQLAERLISGKVGDTTLDVVKAAVAQRWSAESDLVDAVELTARQAALLRAEKAGQVDDVEDQLFRFSRLLDAQPRLAILLGNYEVAAESRVGLLRNVLRNSDVNDITADLLAKTIELLRGQPAEVAVQSLAEVAVARRGEVVAQVSAAAELSESQHTRLTDVLSRIYGHPVTAQINIDPELLGGLAIAVGDEIIDGTLAARLAAAQTQLPD